MRVLVVDPHPDCRETLGRLLTLWGHEAWTAADAPEALRRVAESRPEVIVSELCLAGLNGWELAAEVLVTPGFPRPLLIALTTGASASVVQRSREAGFDLHLVKPPDLELLREVLGSPGRPPGPPGAA